MKKIIYSVFTLLLLSTAGCKDEFFDINQNPNAPTEAEITPQLILPRTLHDVAARMATEYDFAAHWMGYWARSGSFGPSLPLENYDITTSYEQAQWGNVSTANTVATTGWYNTLYDVDVMERKAAEAGQTYYQGIAKVLKSIGFMYLVDMYGDVPYSQAFKGLENLTPAYDDDQAIYADLLNQLDLAQELIKNADATVNPAIATTDIMFKGNKTSWRRLINTQRLKLLIHMSEVVTPATVTATMAKITADGSGFIGAGQTASVQPGYSIDAGRQNPFWNAYKLTPTGGNADDFNRANNYVLFKLEDSNDPRYQAYFSPATTPIGGATYFGYDFGFINPDPDQPKAANSSNVAGPGLAKEATQAQWLFTSVESLFLQAEARQRGWLTGDPKAAFQAAVRESFVWLNVGGSSAAATTAANTYLAQTTPEATPLVNYDAATDKIKLIVTQKYLSLVGINNFEAWVDYRRLGVPTDLPLSLNPGRSGRGIPVRLAYPQTEYSYNAANVTAEGTINTQTSRVFWDKN